MAMGPVDDDPKNRDIATKAGSMTSTGRSLPTAKAKKRNRGKSTPNIKVPGRR
jgi:hypothetical protein